MKKGLTALLVCAALALPVAASAEKANLEKSSDTVAGQIAESKSSAKELITAAKRLKANKEYYKAANSLLRAAELSKGVKNTGLRVKAARLFGWSGAHNKAAETYLTLLDEDPKNRAARLGLAQIYSWSGNQAGAIAEYETVLKARPNDSTALLGRARVRSWMGEYSTAIKEFSAILASDPDNKEAREAKARTLWWMGKHAASVEELNVILTKNSGNKEIKRLKRRIEWDAGRTFSLLWAAASDSDSNDIESIKASLYINHKRAGKLHFDFTRYDVKRLSDTGHATVISIKDSIRLTSRVKLRTSLSLVNSKSRAISNSYITGGVSTDIKVRKKVRVILSVRRSPYLDTAQLLRSNITVDTISGTVIHDYKKTTISGSIAYNDFSDSNSSYSLRANIAHTLLKEPDYTLTAGYIPEYRDFSKKTFSGYYNPSKVFSNDLYLNIKGFSYKDRLEYNATATAGLQNSTESEVTGALRFGALYYIKGNFTVEAAAKWSRSALATSTGFRSNSFKAGLRYLF